MREATVATLSPSSDQPIASVGKGWPSIAGSMAERSPSEKKWHCQGGASVSKSFRRDGEQQEASTVTQGPHCPLYILS